MTLQVVSSLVHFTEQAAAWEAGGKQGPAPTYAASSAACAAASRPPGQLGRPPKSKSAKAGKSAPRPALSIIPPQQVMPLAAQIVGRVLLGAGTGGPAGSSSNLDAVVQLLLQHYRLPSELALRQALAAQVQAPLPTAQPAAAAAGGSAVPAVPAVTVLQYQAAVGLVASMLCQVSAAHSAGSGSSASSGGQPHPTSEAAAGAGSSQNNEGQKKKKRSATAVATAAAGAGAGLEEGAALWPAAPKPPKKPRTLPAGGAGGAAGDGAKPASVNKAPPLMCFGCHGGVAQEGAQPLLQALCR